VSAKSTKRALFTLLVAILAAFSVLGAWLVCTTILPIFLAIEPRSGLPCTPPPRTFSQADLIGTWEAGVPRQRDTLIIREDGTYKQLVHIEYTNLPPVDFESDWQAWWLEERENRIPYLHLQGMRRCGFNPEISCNRVGGDGHDFCRNARVSMDNEGILLVLGVPKPLIRLFGTDAPRGITVVFPAGSENSWDYSLKDSEEVP
jgi:hypothetical protein